MTDLLKAFAEKAAPWLGLGSGPSLLGDAPICVYYGELKAKVFPLDYRYEAHANASAVVMILDAMKRKEREMYGAGELSPAWHMLWAALAYSWDELSTEAVLRAALAAEEAGRG